MQIATRLHICFTALLGSSLSGGLGLKLAFWHSNPRPSTNAKIKFLWHFLPNFPNDAKSHDGVRQLTEHTYSSAHNFRSLHFYCVIVSVKLTMNMNKSAVDEKIGRRHFSFIWYFKEMIFEVQDFVTVFEKNRLLFKFLPNRLLKTFWFSRLKG